MTPEKVLNGTTSLGKNRRKRDRLELSLPIRVNCRESYVENWEEVTRLIDVTPFGAGFALAHSVEVGRLLQLLMPLPRQLRCFDHLEPQYRIWGIVRHVRRLDEETASKMLYNIGVAFIGKNPPASYEADPSTIYEVSASDEQGFCRVQEVSKRDNTKSKKNAVLSNPINGDARRQTRHPIPVTVQIDVFDENGATTASEMTVTENINETGAAVFTTLPVERGRFVRVTCEQYNVSVVAVIRRRRIGADGIVRLHLEFIDRNFPLEGIDL